MRGSGTGPGMWRQRRRGTGLQAQSARAKIDNRAACSAGHHMMLRRSELTPGAALTKSQ